MPVLLSRTRRENRETNLGQSMVEFALVLPVILFLTLIALDFGRVYLGYINLQNMARIASNYAANNPDAWGATPNPTAPARYTNQILADGGATPNARDGAGKKTQLRPEGGATNCQLRQSGGTSVVPAPTFEDRNADGS